MAFRSELHIPIQKDNLSFQDREIKQWDELGTKMQQRRKEWESEFDRMREEFFTLNAPEPTSNTVSKLDDMKTMYDVDESGKGSFKIRFDVKEFKPEEVQVKIQQNKLIVQARHEEKAANTSVTRQYSRQVDIPSTVDEDKMQCILSNDGVLSVEAPIKRLAIGQDATFLPNRAHTVQNLSSSPVRVELNPRVETSQTRSPIITDPDGTRKLKLDVDVGEFSPDEVIVRTIDKKVIVTASHEEMKGGRKMTRSFNKEYELPDSVDPVTVNAYMSDTGTLTIEAPMKAQPAPVFAVTQTHDTRRVVTTQASTVPSGASMSKPLFTISVHRN